MRASLWRIARWTAAIIGFSVFACGAVNRLTAGGSGSGSGSSSADDFDALVATASGSSGDVATEDAGPSDNVATGPDAGEATEPAPAQPPARSGPCAARSRPRLFGHVNLNTATLHELTRLPGIGLAKAERIVAFRSRRGPFRAVRELRRVKGFGRKSVHKLAQYLIITGPTTLRFEYP